MLSRGKNTYKAWPWIIAMLVSMSGLAAAKAPVAAEELAGQGEDQEKDAEGETEPLPLTPPSLKNQVSAEYPAAALEEGIEAEVVLEIDIDAEGMVEGVIVLEPAEPAGYGFDDAAVMAANLFEFTPAMEGDVPVPVRITYRYRFELGAEAAQTDTTVETERELNEEISKEPPAAQVNFAGTLKERGTRLPLNGVTVTVFKGEGEDATGFETISDEEGRFEFYALPEGPWRVLASPEGYYPLRTTERISESERTDAVYFLEKRSYNPYDVLVEGVEQRKEVSRTSIQIEEIEKVPGTFGDVLAVVQNLPGVARTSPTGSSLVVRGSSPEDSQVFVEGVNVPIIYHFGGLRSVIPMGMLSGIDFYPGNFSSEYSRATGGIVDVRLKRLAPEKTGGYMDLNLIDAGAYLEVPVTDKVAFALAARRSYIDAFLTAFVPDGAPVNLVTAPRYYDYQILATARPSRDHEITAFFFGSDDELEILFDNPADIDPGLVATDATTSTSFYRTLLEYRFVPSDKVENVFKTAAGRNMIYAGLGDQVFLDLNTYNAQIRDKLTIGLGDHIKLSAGVDYLFTKADARIKFPDLSKEGEPGGRPDLDEVKFTEGKGEVNHSLGSFLEIQARMFDKLTLVPGVRHDYFSRVDENSLAPRLNARFDILKPFTVKGGVGLFYQEPSFDETDEVFGNPDLGLERAVHYSAGFEWRPLDHLLLDITGFYKDMDDLVSRTDGMVERGGETVPENYVNGGEGRVWGLEVLLRHEFANNFSGWLSYTLSKAERRDFGSSEWRPFDFDQTHILTVLGTYQLPKNWSIGMRWRLVSGNPVTTREGSVYNVDDGVYEPIPGTTNTERMPFFHQLDIRVDKRWIYENWILTAYLDLQNAYNRANPVGYSYNYDSSERTVRQSLPILPVIGLKGEF